MKVIVKEARPRDVGRAIARINHELMQELDLKTGDIAKIGGLREAYARILPAYPEDGISESIQIDGIIRTNIKSGINDTVTLEKADLPALDMAVLKPLEAAAGRDIDCSPLTGYPLQKDDIVRLAIFGRQITFHVDDTHPDCGTVNEKTIIKIRGQVLKEQEKKRGFTSYEDIGGLRPQLQKIREMAELPLRYPELFEKIGIDPPKGVLLYGPPGTGKTLIAKAVANEVNAHFIYISGPEIMGKYYGESESRLRDIFTEAEKNAPSVVFIDEIDSIAPKREELSGEKQVEKRVVAQLLALMDGIQNRGQVIVIAATNMPNLLDPALRRPGRFDREIEIAIPDKTGRSEIFEIHMRGMPIEDDVVIDEIAAATHGYVGADIAALCREAAMCALRRILPEIDFSRDYIPYNLLSGLVITGSDINSAMLEIRPSALREVFIERPDVDWDDVGGLDEIKDKIRSLVELPIKRPALYRYAGVDPPKGIMLHGPPGTGKTHIAKALANKTGTNFISVKGPEIFSKYLGESEKTIREIFRKARMAAPCIIFFDEIDAIAPARSGGDERGQTDRVVSQMLIEMDGIEELKGVLVLAATNRPDIIDPALMRPGRFDIILELPLPDENARIEIFKIHLRNKPLAADISIPSLAKETEGFSGAEIESVCKTAAHLAIQEFSGGDDEIDKLYIGKSYFEGAVNSIHK